MTATPTPARGPSARPAAAGRRRAQVIARACALALSAALPTAAAPADPPGPAPAAAPGRPHPVLERLRAAEAALAAAADPRGRLAALGEAAASQEAALLALRAELRALAPRRVAAVAARRAAQEDGFAAASALDRLARTPGPAWFVHPGGPVAAARAGMLLGDAAGDLARRAQVAGQAAEALAALEAEGRRAGAAAAEALGAMRATRAAIAEALEARGAPPADPDAGPRDAATLAAAAGALAALLAATAAPEPLPGGLPPPVPGRLLRADDDGAAIAAPAWSVVRAPATATLRHAGEVGGLGLVAVLEPAPGVLIVLRGLSRIWRAPGETLLAGEPLGAMGGPPPTGEEFLFEATAGRGAVADETLYIEVRQGGMPANPAGLFDFARGRTEP